MLLADVGTTVELLIARRHVQRRVPVEKVGRLELDFDDLARHDREVLNARDVLKTKLHPNHDIIVYNILFAVSPRSYPSTSTRLVSILPTCIELTVMVLGDVDIMIGKLCSFVMKGVGVSDHLLEGRCVDLISDCFAIHWVPRRLILDLENAIGIVVCVKSTGFPNNFLFHSVANTVGIEVRSRHWMYFLINKTIGVTIDRWVDAEGKDVLVVRGQDTRMDYCSPWNIHAVINGLRADDSGCPDFVRDFSCLVEHKSHDVSVIRNCYDGLNNKLSAPNKCSSAGTVIGVFPPNTGVLLMQADHVIHRHCPTFVICEDSTQVVDRSQAVAAEL